MAVSFLHRAKDSLRNFVGNLGTTRDKASGNFYLLDDYSDQDFFTAYRAAWLPQKIVDIPAFDACRRWRNWNAPSEKVLAIEAEEARLNVCGKVLEGLISARLFGGAALYINVPSSDPAFPLNPKMVGKGGIKSLVLLPRNTISWTEIESDIQSPYFGMPKYWEISPTGGTVVKIHPSRLILLSGHKVPKVSVSSDFYWGDSALLAVMQAMHQADSSTANVASLLFESKIDVLGIPNLMENIADKKYRDDLYSRLEVAAIGKGNNGMFIKDTEESYEQKKMNFSTIPEVMDRFFQNVAGAADIPMTRLYGMSPGGMNSTGDSDLKNYYDRIQSMQKLDIAPAMALFDECLVRSALGATPRGVYYEWRSLWQSSEKEEAEISKGLAEAMKTLKETNVFSQEFLAELIQAVMTDRGAMVGFDAVVEKIGRQNLLGMDFAARDPYASLHGTPPDPNDAPDDTPDPKVV